MGVGWRSGGGREKGAGKNKVRGGEAQRRQKKRVPGDRLGTAGDPQLLGPPQQDLASQGRAQSLAPQSRGRPPPPAPFHPASRGCPMHANETVEDSFPDNC